MTIDSNQKFIFELENEGGQSVVKGEISGESEIPSGDDVKFNAIIALLNSIDKKNFVVAGKVERFDHYLTEIEETIHEMKKHDQFQGNVK